ncbi:hypothetical protein MML48_2g00004580 [Holotrichia oblita]|uniref:Uncharacterized protein n=1 Tax=Holotrichia oblita TaxID=644536 RepID=A0ACB9TKB6_HOLOL|nr:hypothetical protein MML48_2g00004580 [Holotrichia oblita]
MQCNEPASVDRLNWLLYIQHVRGEVASCKQLIKDEIAKSNGKNEYAFIKKFLLKRYRLAFEAYTEAEKSSDKADWEIFHNVGRNAFIFTHKVGECLILLGNIPKAREYANKAVQCGKQETSYALLIKILLMENDIRSAIAVCNAALEVCPDSVNMLSKSGLLYIKTGQTQLAFERLSSGLALNPVCAEALLGIGCITQVRYIHMYTKNSFWLDDLPLHILFPVVEAIAFNLTSFLFQSHEEYDVALTKYKLAVQHRPDSVALWNNIGMCFYSKQKYIAVSVILLFSRIRFPNSSAFSQGKRLLMRNERIERMLGKKDFLLKTLRLYLETCNLIFIVISGTLLLLEDTENALKAMKHAFTLAQDQPIVVLDTAVLCYKNGLTDEALEHVMKFEQLIGSKENNETKPQEVSIILLLLCIV